MIIVLFFAFRAHYAYPSGLAPYSVLNDAQYDALSFLSGQEKSNVMANLVLSLAVYPASGMNPVGALNFYGDRGAVERFFDIQNCTAKNEILAQYSAKYVVVDGKIECNWTIIYEKDAINLYKAG
jgi:hypothetical protein